jgi:hypothetical protein
MIWAKRRFAADSYGKYHDRLGDLQMAMPNRHREFMMMARKSDTVGEQDIYIAVPSKELLSSFDGFEIISESELPKEVDTLLLAEHGEFEKRFRVRKGSS